MLKDWEEHSLNQQMVLKADVNEFCNCIGPYEKHMYRIAKTSLDVIKELEAKNYESESLIKKMIPYCKTLCKNYVKTGYMGNDCIHGTCRKCDKWQFDADNYHYVN